MRDQLRTNAEQLARENDLEIEFIRKKNIRKESRIKEILKKRENHPGLVYIFSAMESCPSYKPWPNKQTHQTYLKPIQAKCLHYYFYFIDEQLGLCYMRVPTWCPFRLQFYFNGHNWLASALLQNDIDYTLMDNAFTQIDSFTEAQKLSDSFTVDLIHQKLDQLATQFCPVIQQFNLRYHWSIM